MHGALSPDGRTRSWSKAVGLAVQGSTVPGGPSRWGPGRRWLGDRRVHLREDADVRPVGGCRVCGGDGQVQEREKWLPVDRSHNRPLGLPCPP